MKRFAIDPSDFSHGQWDELAAHGTLVPAKNGFWTNAKPFNRSKKQIVLMIEILENKAQHIRDGGLGPEDRPGQDEEWILDLHAAADQLRVVIGEKPINRKEVRDRLYDLLTSDIYTDAPE